MNIRVSNIKPNIVTTPLEASTAIGASNKYLSVTIAMGVMDPYEAEALMRFKATLFLMDCQLKRILLSTHQLHLTLWVRNLLWPTVSIKIVRLLLSYLTVASEQRISTSKVFFFQLLRLMDTSTLTCNLEFFNTSKVRILYWGLQVLKQLNVVIHPS